MQWNKKPCPYLKTVTRQVQNQEQTQEVRLPEEMPDIGRVLCTWGQCMIRSKDWRGDGMNVSGGVSASVMYLPEDGSFPRTVEVWLPFQVKWSFPQSQKQLTMRVQCLLHSLDARILSARKMMVRSNISMLGEALEEKEAEIYSPGQVPEGVEILTMTYPAMLPRETGEKIFSFEDEIRIPNVQKWISWRMEPQITEQSVVGNRVVVRGNGQLHFVYMDEAGAIHSGRQEIPFAQFVELDTDHDKEATADVMLAVSSLEPEISPEGAHIQCGMLVQYLVWDRMLLEIAEDAYSPVRSVEITRDDLALPMELDHRTEAADAQPQFRDGKVLDVTFLPEFPGQFREGDSVNMVLSGAFQILYEDVDGSLQTTMENWSEERPFPVSANGQLHTMIQSINVQEPGSIVNMKLELRTVADQEIPMITDLTIGECQTPDENRPALILKRMDAESLWEFAKNSGSTMDAIRRANGLTQEPDRGQMLLIPIS